MYEAKDIYSEKRQEATQKIVERLKERVQYRGIEIEEVLLRHVQLPADLAKSIQEKLQAEQEAEMNPIETEIQLMVADVPKLGESIMGDVHPDLIPEKQMFFFP